MKTPEIRLKLYIPGKEFLLPYIERELPDAKFVNEDYDAVVAIVSPNEKLPEGFDKNAAVLVCPNIVGTGMNGLPMTIAEKIARGMYFHVSGNDARLSTVHAVDVARAVRITLGKPGRYAVTDCQDPTFHDFAEALAWRISHKRILTPTKNLYARLLLGNLYNIITTDSVVDGLQFAEEFGFKPTPVTEYLRTHNYDDESL